MLQLAGGSSSSQASTKTSTSSKNVELKQQNINQQFQIQTQQQTTTIDVTSDQSIRKNSALTEEIFAAIEILEKPIEVINTAEQKSSPPPQIGDSSQLSTSNGKSSPTNTQQQQNAPGKFTKNKLNKLKPLGGPPKPSTKNKWDPKANLKSKGGKAGGSAKDGAAGGGGVDQWWNKKGKKHQLKKEESKKEGEEENEENAENEEKKADEDGTDLSPQPEEIDQIPDHLDQKKNGAIDENVVKTEDENTSGIDEITGDKVVEKPVEQVVERPVEQVIETPVEQVADKAAEKTGEQTGLSKKQEKTGNQVAEKSNPKQEGSGDRVTENSVPKQDKAVEQIENKIETKSDETTTMKATGEQKDEKRAKTPTSSNGADKIAAEKPEQKSATKTQDATDAKPTGPGKLNKVGNSKFTTGKVTGKLNFAQKKIGTKLPPAKLNSTKPNSNKNKFAGVLGNKKNKFQTQPKDDGKRNPEKETEENEKLLENKDTTSTKETETTTKQAEQAIDDQQKSTTVEKVVKEVIAEVADMAVMQSTNESSEVILDKSTNSNHLSSTSMSLSMRSIRDVASNDTGEDQQQQQQQHQMEIEGEDITASSTTTLQEGGQDKLEVGDSTSGIKLVVVEEQQSVNQINEVESENPTTATTFSEEVISSNEEASTTVENQQLGSSTMMESITMKGQQFSSSSTTTKSSMKSIEISKDGRQHSGISFNVETLGFEGELNGSGIENDGSEPVSYKFVFTQAPTNATNSTIDNKTMTSSKTITTSTPASTPQHPYHLFTRVVTDMEHGTRAESYEVDDNRVVSLTEYDELAVMERPAGYEKQKTNRVSFDDRYHYQHHKRSYMEYDADSIYMDIFDIIKKMREKTGQVINRQDRLEMRMDITTTPPISPPPTSSTSS